MNDQRIAVLLHPGKREILKKVADSLITNESGVFKWALRSLFQDFNKNFEKLEREESRFEYELGIDRTQLSSRVPALVVQKVDIIANEFGVTAARLKAFAVFRFLNKNKKNKE